MEAPVAQLFQGQRKPPRLNLRELQRQTLAVEGRIKLPAPAIESPGSDLNEILVDELSQHPVEALFCDPQNLQKLRNRQTRSSSDKIEHPVMSAPKSIGLEQAIGVCDKIAIGEKKQFDQLVHGFFAARRAPG